jgi:ribonuclease P protein component
MLPKKQRIPRKMFSLFSVGAKNFRNKMFLIRLMSTIDGASRFCFSVSKKVAKSAVVRNKLRRMGYNFLVKQPKALQSKKMAIISFLLVPTNKSDFESNLNSILIESKLI